jgi:hypothetical protein
LLRSQKQNGELDTCPTKFHNQVTFGTVIREVAKDRSKDVIDIRDATKAKTPLATDRYRSRLDSGKRIHYVYPYFR